MQKLILVLGLSVASTLSGPLYTAQAQPREHFGVTEEFPSHDELNARMDALAPILDIWLAHGLRTGDAPG